MASKRKREREIAQEQDKFLDTADKVSEKLKPHAKMITLVTIFVVLAGGAYFVWGWHKNKKAEEATAALAATMDTMYRMPDEGDERSREQRMLDALDKNKGQLAQLDTATNIIRARALFDEEKYEESAAAWGEVVNGSLPTGLKPYAQEAHALAVEAAGGDADKVLGLLAEAESSGSQWATFHRARLLIGKNQVDQALPMLEKLANSDDEAVNEGLRSAAEQLLVNPKIPAKVELPKETTPPVTSDDPAPATEATPGEDESPADGDNDSETASSAEGETSP